VQVAAKAELHVVGLRLVVTITARRIYVEALADMTGLSAEFKEAHTNHGADLILGLIFLAVLQLVLDLEFLEHTVANLGWDVT
jgi:hypothetical protein